MEEIFPGLFYVESKSQSELGKRFKRFYGHYESPKLKRKIFSEKRFDSWFRNNTIYGKEYDLEFDQIVGGINIPGWVFDSFIEGKFNPLNELEKELVENVIKKCPDDFYVISSMPGEWFDFRHEIAHGLYYLSDDYRKDIEKIMNKIGSRNYARLEKELVDEGVTHEEALRDEIHAHLLSNYEFFIPKISTNTLLELNKKITNVFDKYWNKNKA